MEPFLNLSGDYELIVVDGGSKDGTYEKLLKYKNLKNFKLIRSKCSRGKGKQIAMDSSSGSTIAHIDFDISYSEIFGIINFYKKINIGKIYNFYSTVNHCAAPLIIGERNLFDVLKGYGDLLGTEDIYFYKKANSVNVLVRILLNYNHRCLKIRGLSSGNERRYEINLFSRIKRRLLMARDLLFVSSGNFNTIKVAYKLHGIKLITQGVPEYIFGKLLLPTVKAEKLDKAIPEVRKRYKKYLEEKQSSILSTEKTE